MRLPALLLVALIARGGIETRPAAETTPSLAEPQPAPVEFSCPMDPEIRSKTPGKCPRCGMTLEARIPEPIEYRLTVKVDPPQAPAGRELSLEFRVADPKTGAPVKNFQIVHERPFHLFVVSEDLEYFAHEHPALSPDGAFRLETRLPKPGTYKLLADFYPDGGTPQLISKVLTTAGYTKSLAAAMVKPTAELSPQHGENLEAELALEPAQPIAGKKTLLLFRLKPADGLEPYLGAWGHLLIASHDFIDVIHTHPTYLTQSADGPQVQFDVFFPREAVYRLWVQFQRNGKVNTVAFAVPVRGLQ